MNVWRSSGVRWGWGNGNLLVIVISFDCNWNLDIVEADVWMMGQYETVESINLILEKIVKCECSFMLNKFKRSEKLRWRRNLKWFFSLRSLSKKVFSPICWLLSLDGVFEKPIPVVLLYSFRTPYHSNATIQIPPQNPTKALFKHSILPM